MVSKHYKSFLAITGITLAMVASMLEEVYASPNGRIRFSGNPLTGGQNCMVCHEAGAPLPNVSIAGPTVVDAETTHQYTVSISGGPGQTGGLNVSVSDAEQFIGLLSPLGGDLQLLFGELTHTAPKAFFNGSVNFTFMWTAPKHNGNVTLYAAGNSSNADGNLNGDGIDTASLGITVQNGSGTTDPPDPSPNTKIKLEQYTSGLDRPVVVTHTGIVGDGRLLVAEQAGRIRVVNAGGALRSTPFLNITNRVDSNGNEKGLLGLAFHPEYAQNGQFFVNYTRPAGSGFRTRIARFTVSGDPNVANPNSEQVILEYAQPFSNHNGGDIHFGPDGYLYIASGDGGSQGDPNNNAQNNSRLLGKLLRIDVDGSSSLSPDCDISGNQNYTIPVDNVFTDGAGGAGCDEIWAKGLRNPWRFSFDRQAGDLWIADVGQNAFEEINYTPVGVSAGINYGWRCFEGDVPFNTSGCPSAGQLTFPVHAFAHAENDSCSVTGGYVYRGTAFPDLRGQYFFSDFCNSAIHALSGSPTNPTVTVVLPTTQSISLPATFGEDTQGELYLASHGSGAVFRIVSTGGSNQSPTAEANGPYSGTVGSAISFSSSGTSDPDGSISSYSWNFGDGSSSSSANPSHSYSNAGTYTVTLTVTDNEGATDSDSTTVTITAPASGLSNGVPRTGLSASTGQYLKFFIDVPSGQNSLEVVISGGSGDADMYVRRGSEPTDSTYDCRPYRNGNSETCSFTNPASGRWYINLKGYSSFSGVSLTATYTGGSSNQSPVAEANGPYSGTVGSAISFSSSGSSDPDGSIASYSWNFGNGSTSTSANPSHTYSSAGTYTATLTVTDNQGASSSDSATVTVTTGSGSATALSNGVPQTGISASTGQYVKFYIDVPSGQSSLNVVMSGGSGDADMYVRRGSEPTDSTYDCRPYRNGNSETCTFTNPASGRWYINLKAYSSFSGVSLTASHSGGSSTTVPNACSSESPYTGNSLSDNDAICVPNGSSSSTTRYFYILVPSGASRLVIQSAHGSGNGNVYYNASSWATSSSYTQNSTNSGNTESITVNNPGSGYRYISVIGNPSGMALVVDIQ